MSGPRQSLGTQADPVVLSDSDDEPARPPQRPTSTPRRNRRVTGLRVDPAPQISDSDSDASDLTAQLNKLRERERRDAAGPSTLAQTPVNATPNSSQPQPQGGANGSSASHANGSSKDKGKGKGKQRETPTSPNASMSQRGLRDYFANNAEAGPSRNVITVDSEEEGRVDRTKRRRDDLPSQSKKKRRTLDGFQEDTRLGSWGNPEPLVIESRPPKPKLRRPASPPGPKLGEWGNFEPLEVLGQPQLAQRAPAHRERGSPEPPAKRKGIMARKSTGGKAPRGVQGGRAPAVPSVAEESAPPSPAPQAPATPLFTTPPPDMDSPVSATRRVGPSWVTDNTSPDKPPSRPLSRPTSRPTSRPASQPRATPEAGPARSQAAAEPAPKPASPKILAAPSPFAPTPPSPARAAASPSLEPMVVDDAPLDDIDVPDMPYDDGSVEPLPEGSLDLTPEPQPATPPVAPDTPEFEIDNDLLAEYFDDDTGPVPPSDTVPAEESASTPVAEQPAEDLAASPRANGAASAPADSVDEARPARARRSRRRSRSKSASIELVLTPPTGRLDAPIEISDDEVEVLEVPPRISRRQWEHLIFSAGRLSDGDGLFKGKESVGAGELAPPGMTGKVNRFLDARMIDQYHKLVRNRPILNPALHRELFETYMSMSTANDEPNAPTIKVVNNIDGTPPDFEFQYSNQMLYTDKVPAPELGQGCGCEGPCDPNSTTCLCVKRQQLYFYNLEGYSGFQYNEDGTVKNHECPIWECGPNCGCPPECMNRVIQRGRSKDTVVELFKTRQKGWGVKAKSHIKRGTFIGIYSGELVTEAETEVRGRVYEKVGRTYLFDLDGYHISHPPAGLKDIDPRAYELARTVKGRAQKWKAKELMERGKISHPSEADEIDDEDCDFSYSAYSELTPFSIFCAQNFTRYINHSCNPNLVTSQAYVRDAHPERPLLVIFARFDIRPGEEMCISYKGLPDGSEVLPEMPRRGGGTRGRHKNKTSVQAHVSPRVAGRSKGGQCKCGMRNCDGNMFPS